MNKSRKLIFSEYLLKSLYFIVPVTLILFVCVSLYADQSVDKKDSLPPLDKWQKNHYFIIIQGNQEWIAKEIKLSENKVEFETTKDETSSRGLIHYKTKKKIMVVGSFVVEEVERYKLNP